MQRFHLSHRPALLIFGITFVVYALLIVFFSQPPGISITNGDEPHYLLQVHSLVHDHDLDVRNNYKNRDYQEFFGDGTLEIGAYLYEYNGRIVRHHFALGMPVLLAPAYALGGRIGVQLFLALLVAMSMSALYMIGERFMTRRYAFVSVLACALTYPVVIYSHQIFPETVIMALLSLVLMLSLTSESQRLRLVALLVGVLLGLMPHFQNKYILLSGLLYTFFLWRWRSHLWIVLRWSFAPIFLFAVAHLAWAYHTYGELGRSTLISPGYSMLADDRIDDGILGLWFDQEAGLFFYAPVYLIALPGFWWLVRTPEQRSTVLYLALIYVSFHLLGGAYYDWPAGLSPVPRYLMPVLPLLILFVGAGIEGLITRNQWVQPMMLGAISLYITCIIIFVQRAGMFAFYIGSNTILREHFRGHFIAERMIERLPSFLLASDAAYPKLLIAISLLLILMVAAIPINRLLVATVRSGSSS